MMAEVVVVAAVILGAFAFFYVNYNKLISLNNERVAYYDVGTLYKLADYIKDKRGDIKGAIEVMEEDSKYYSNVSFDLGSLERVYLLDKYFFASSTEMVENLAKTEGLRNTFKKYLSYLAQAKNLGDVSRTQHIIVMENCIDNDNNCKYAYLETAVE